ncbi:MAG: hypothetical protein QW275_02175 [Candidatus Anstonellaceae archaeon]
MDIKEAVGFAAAFTTALGFLPKVYSVWKKRSAKSIEWWLVLVFSLDIILWFIYGYLIASTPTMLAALLVSFFVLEIAAVKAKYG